ncbi:MAG: manganese efflux pump [Thermoleophilia bacterium]|nr:manganese efflux pump [Thermoleophilia bacterium]
MSFLTLIAIAVGLAMDAFAVSVGVGLKLCQVNWRQTFRLGFHFGLFQALMPVLGWLAGRTIAGYVEAGAYWIAFVLLAAIGGRMIWESFHGGEERAAVVADPTKGLSLVVLSVATSIDALAVGVSLAMLEVGIWWPSVVIGIVAGTLTVVGLHVGCRLGAVFGRRMETVGGVILILIGIRIVVENFGG